jgi:AraC-like DNA-binding protein
MFQSLLELINRDNNPASIPHPHYSNGIRTFSCLKGWNNLPVLEFPSLRVEIHGIDFLERSAGEENRQEPLLMHFQQNTFRLWFQIEGNGILQNLSQNIFGPAKPGLLGIMERSRRYSYLHKKGAFECFQLLFSLLPASGSKCYWNSDIEGKCILEGGELVALHQLVSDLILLLAGGKAGSYLSITARLLDILAVLFFHNILSIDESQFPKNKAKCLVKKAKSYMELNYARMRHQRELEQECGVDINYLNIVFKKETGDTLYDYLSGIRMEQAKHLLATTSDPVTDIACRIGYPNNNSFSRAFKRWESFSPLGFRSKYSSNASGQLSPAETAL